LLRDHSHLCPATSPLLYILLGLPCRQTAKTALYLLPPSVCQPLLQQCTYKLSGLKLPWVPAACPGRRPNPRHTGRTRQSLSLLCLLRPQSRRLFPDPTPSLPHTSWPRNIRSSCPPASSPWQSTSSQHHSIWACSVQPPTAQKITTHWCLLVRGLYCIAAVVGMGRHTEAGKSNLGSTQCMSHHSLQVV